ncbi:hypothetical protein ACS0TY_000244 [Phlomoides rotata]
MFIDSKGRNHIALLNTNAKSEIILSAGAVGSLQLLMLSGIGSAQHLQAHGISVIMDQPMVGQGMSDNPLNVVLIPLPEPVETSLVEIVGILDDVGCYIEAASGLVGPTSISIFPIINQTISQFGFIGEKLARPFSIGYLELQSNDLNENPKVTFNYFKDPRDLQRCVQSMEIVKRVVESNAFSKFWYPFTSFESLLRLTLAIPSNLRRRHVITGALSLEQYCVDTVMTIWHFHGGCQVGRVVDPDYRVMGVDSLGVIDASTFYYSPGTNPQATVMMLGRYMGKRILQQNN